MVNQNAMVRRRCRLVPETIVEKHDLYLEMRFKVEAVVEHYAAQSESV
jgi:hypothetical protein